MTQRFVDVLHTNNIVGTKAPPNMTHIFQPLDFTINKFAKRFSKWFSKQIEIGLENGQELENIVIGYRLSTLKALHVE